MSDLQKLRDVQAQQQRLNELKTPTVGELAESGLFSFAGRIASPFGAWHCPACWTDYAAGGQYAGAAA